MTRYQHFVFRIFSPTEEVYMDQLREAIIGGVRSRHIRKYTLKIL